MRKFRSILLKEFLLLTRDIPGLIILFLMPALLIFVVTLAQESALRAQQERTRVLVGGPEGGPSAERIAAVLDSSGFYATVTAVSGVPVNAASARQLVSRGDYGFAILCLPADSGIVILTDPTLRESYRQSVVQSLTYMIRSDQGRQAVDEILATLPAAVQPVMEATIRGKMRNLPPVRESFALRDRSTIKPNVIQNNVPGFILFGMFFIVIPMAGSLITERSEGSYTRLRTLPVGLAAFLGGKVTAFLAVCLLQFLLMTAIGTLVLPGLFGLPALDLGHAPGALAVATLAASLAATGFGLLVGTLSTSHSQAALFGSVMVVLLGIISGTFLPVHLLPQAIRMLSELSPIRWGIDNYLELFIREGGMMAILPGTLKLLLFFILSMFAGIAIFASSSRRK